MTRRCTSKVPLKTVTIEFYIAYWGCENFTESPLNTHYHISKYMRVQDAALGAIGIRGEGWNEKLQWLTYELTLTDMEKILIFSSFCFNC